MTGESYVKGKLVDLKFGNTDVATQMIAEMIGAKRFQIQTVKTYPSGHMNLIKEAEEEINENARPELLKTVEHMEQYDAIILGYPNWWGTIPMPVATFLESYDFTGKKIYPLCTNEGSGLADSVGDIKKLVPAAEVESGLAVNGGEVQNSKAVIENWLQRNNLID